MSSGKWRPFCLSLNVLRPQIQCWWKTFMVHQTLVWWALYILYKFGKFPIRHLSLAIGYVRRFSPTLQIGEKKRCYFEPKSTKSCHNISSSDQSSYLNFLVFLSKKMPHRNMLSVDFFIYRIPGSTNSFRVLHLGSSARQIQPNLSFGQVGLTTWLSSFK